MAEILLKIILAATFGAALVRSWVGVAAYYTLSLWYPQLIWYWAFGTLRSSLIVSIATILGFGKEVFLGKVDFLTIFKRQNIYIILLWISIVISYLFSPIEQGRTDNVMLSGSYLFAYFNRIFFFYFISVLLIDTKEKLHYLIICFLVVILYYIYWSNEKYLSGGMLYGPRLRGPGPEGEEWTGQGGGPYTDENCFAMLFVMGIPFLFFMANYYKNILIKGLLWGAIPFAWHSIFLTGSQGGLVGVGVVTVFIALRSDRKSVV